MRVRRRLARLALAVAVSFSSAGLLVVSATPAQAVGCYGDYCSGQDPQATGCANDAITVAASNQDTYSLQLRWSPTCQTNWARLVIYPAGMWHLTADATLSAVQNTGYTQWTTTYSEGTYWTPMIYSPVHCVKATVQNNHAPYNYDETACV